MTKCKNCCKETNCVCICGYCMDCNDKHTHKELNEMQKERGEKE